MNLFDASSIYTLVKHAKGDASKILKAGSTTLLAAYELGNAAWRETHLVKLLTEDEAKELLSLLYALLETMTIVPFEPRRDGGATLESSLATGLSFYDASYLSAAIKTGHTLVTEDKRLARIASRLGVKTLSWHDL
jgi:predicted nucleic acid-binding protein